MSSGPMRVKSYRWQRERMVAGTFWISVVARMKMTCQYLAVLLWTKHDAYSALVHQSELKPIYQQPPRF